MQVNATSQNSTPILTIPILDEAVPALVEPEVELEEDPRFDLLAPIVREAFATRGTKRIKIVHTNRRATTLELEAYDNARPYRAQSAGKDTEEILTNLSGEPEVKLYEKTVLRTEGYKYNVSPDQSKEERKIALLNIPASHKVDIVRSMLTIDSEVIFDQEDEAEGDNVVWGEDIEYRIRTEMFKDGEVVAHSTLREPSQAQIENYVPQKYFVERGTKNPITRISISLMPSEKLFDSLVTGVDGFRVGKEAFNVSNPKHLALIDGKFKQSVINKLLEATRLDLGN